MLVIMRMSCYGFGTMCALIGITLICVADSHAGTLLGGGALIWGLLVVTYGWALPWINRKFNDIF